MRMPADRRATTSTTIKETEMKHRFNRSRIAPYRRADGRLRDVRPARVFRSADAQLPDQHGREVHGRRVVEADGRQGFDQGVRQQRARLGEGYGRPGADRRDRHGARERRVVQRDRAGIADPVVPVPVPRRRSFPQGDVWAGRPEDPRRVHREGDDRADVLRERRALDLREAPGALAGRHERAEGACNRRT